MCAAGPLQCKNAPYAFKDLRFKDVNMDVNFEVLMLTNAAVDVRIHLTPYESYKHNWLIVNLAQSTTYR